MTRSLLALLVAAPIVLGAGCRCRQDTLPPVVFDDVGDDGPIDPARVLAPPWQAPAVSQLDNGALLHWFIEPGTPAFHLRVLMPTSEHAERLSAAGTATSVQALEIRLAGRLRRIEDAHYDVRSRGGRVEFAVHGRDRDAEALVLAVAETLADAGDPKLLAVAQGKKMSKHREPDASALAAAGLVTTLLGHRLAHQYATKADLVALTRARLERAWSLLSDPRHCLVVVHSSRPASELAEPLALLGSRWKVGVLGTGKPNATARMHHPATNKQPATSILGGAEPALLHVLPGKPDGRGRAVVMMGRVLSTSTAEERAKARLSQRLMQEELDVRLIPGGPISILAVRVQVGSDPAGDVARTIDAMREVFAKAQPELRVRQAADLWLGARMIEASVNGEDWTALWSESIDLAVEDREVFAALAREAKTMLELDPEQIREYQEQWFDPKGGQPGWVWVISGASSEQRTKLATKVQLVDL